METNLFEEERVYYDANKERLFNESWGKVVLIKGDKEYGLYDTPESAYNAGIQLFGNVPFFIQELMELDMAANYPAHLVNFV
ncbi:MAG: hypothetical protein BWX80_01991 [Candidatus Hydrogenedentes bacterium ADurb.Bin101]|jgi:hypothetical protein|nr:MAG: hypothetical protein BWX80_01991 [Candidatus Hydrogenedentes bacterium ADurb.Bin101]HOC69729.1 hypothetical protein [Candidatus Hydrogenedentota bacterium]